ncbi:MAG: His/Gly/Thr/Pro-type tRNA ligase C-terminal domain-containing protein, partial [Bacteroidales bacterium]
FQVVAPGGEDTIYHCIKCGWAFNEEVFNEKEVKKPIDVKYKTECVKCGGEVVKDSSIEVGNIFSFGRSYSKMMNVTFTDSSGNINYPYFGSYGIGTTRVMGAWVEVSHDDKGIIWSREIAPYMVHLIEVVSDNSKVRTNAKIVYKMLKDNGIEILWDDRPVSAGEKFNDADLIGIPVRLVISEKTKGIEVEYKERSKENIEMVKQVDLVKRLSA